MNKVRNLYIIAISFGKMSINRIPHFTKIIADSDFDGLCGAAILKKYNPSAEVIFSHAALIRSGSVDELIDSETAIVDLPFHEKCGWYLDHHRTNKPSPKQLAVFTSNGGVVDWQPTPSAARLVYEIIKPYCDLSNFLDLMPFVDELDSGGITLQQFQDDNELMRFSRTLSKTEPEYMQMIVEMMVSGSDINEILATPMVAEKVAFQYSHRLELMQIVEKNTHIIDRLAICHLEDTGFFTNGYLVTATVGDDADACCIIHGYSDGSIDSPDRPPLSASFYANSFHEHGQGRYDLSRLATAFDPNGGGHVNACGCRIQDPGLEHNLGQWLGMWQRRDIELRVD